LSDPTIAVVIPAASAPDVFSECLRSLFLGVEKPDEVIIVNDAMDQTALDIAEQYPVRVVKNPHKGVSAARNYGARVAGSDIILFIDTDVIIDCQAIQLIRTIFQDAGIDGAVGVQSKSLRFMDFFSRYKNHWMRYTYRRLKENIHLFYTSCAAIRREVFIQTGGFDENYRLPSVEDTAFGAVLGASGIRIQPLPDFEIEHVKAYGLKSILVTDFNRSAALVRYVLRNRSQKTGGDIGKTSVPKQFMLSSAIMTIALFALFLLPVWSYFSLITFLISWIFIIGLNTSWISHLFQEEGIGFAIKACFFLPVDVTFVVLGIFWGIISFAMGKKY